MIEFKKTFEKAEFYNPSEEETKTLDVEIRKDPLTEKSSRVLTKSLPTHSDPDMSDVEKDGFCPFCPESVDEVGARDTRILDKEKMERGEAVLIANITPYSKYSLVVRLCEDHYLPLDKFKEKHFYDGLMLVRDYLKKVFERENDVFPALIMNYLKPAGSTIVHPHMQLLVTETPMDYQKRMIDAAQKFYEENGKNYWDRLIKKEKDGDRYLGNTNNFDWITAYAPKGYEHIKGICGENLANFEKESIDGLAEGITQALKAYSDMEYNSFNFSIFVPPYENSDEFSTVVDIIRRTNLDRFYRADDFAMPKLIDEPYVNKSPEDLAEEIREFFD